MSAGDEQIEIGTEQRRRTGRRDEREWNGREEEQRETDGLGENRYLYRIMPSMS